MEPTETRPGSFLIRRYSRKRREPPSEALILAGMIRVRHTCLTVLASVVLTIPAVPVFDGRQQFQLGNYWNHPYEERVAKGSTVMVLFSIRKSALPKAMKNAPESIKFVVYLNLLGVIVLEEPVDEVAGGPSQEEPQAFGVNSVRRIEEFHTGKQNADEENSEGGETVLDEAFL